MKPLILLVGMCSSLVAGLLYFIIKKLQKYRDKEDVYRGWITLLGILFKIFAYIGIYILVTMAIIFLFT